MESYKDQRQMCPKMSFTYLTWFKQTVDGCDDPAPEEDAPHEVNVGEYLPYCQP